MCLSAMSSTLKYLYSLKINVISSQNNICLWFSFQISDFTKSPHAVGFIYMYFEWAYNILAICIIAAQKI